MAALRSRGGHYTFVLFLSVFIPRLISAVVNWMSTIYLYTWCGPSANLECSSEMCCTRFASNRTKKSPKLRHLGTVAQLCRAISSQLRHISTIGKKLLNSNVSPTCHHNGELRPTSGWDLLARLGHPSKFRQGSHLGSVTARHSSSGRQPKFAALNRGRHQHSEGRPSRWALAHILVCLVPCGRLSWLLVSFERTLI